MLLCNNINYNMQSCKEKLNNNKLFVLKKSLNYYLFKLKQEHKIRNDIIKIVGRKLRKWWMRQV